MSSVSTQVVKSMFNHLIASYSADEAREILVQKYPDMEGEIELLTDPSLYGEPVETVEATDEEIDLQAETAEADLVKAVKAKTAKPKKEKVSKPKKVKAEKPQKAESKVDIARKLYAAAEDKSRGAMIQVFMDQLGMSKAAASTYYYNVKQ